MSENSARQKLSLLLIICIPHLSPTTTFDTSILTLPSSSDNQKWQTDLSAQGRQCTCDIWQVNWASLLSKGHGHGVQCCCQNCAGVVIQVALSDSQLKQNLYIHTKCVFCGCVHFFFFWLFFFSSSSSFFKLLGQAVKLYQTLRINLSFALSVFLPLCFSTFHVCILIKIAWHMRETLKVTWNQPKKNHKKNAQN